jgi:hypothetical protein
LTSAVYGEGKRSRFTFKRGDHGTTACLRIPIFQLQPNSFHFKQHPELAIQLDCKIAVGSPDAKLGTAALSCRTFQELAAGMLGKGLSPFGVFTVYSTGEQRPVNNSTPLVEHEPNPR